MRRALVALLLCTCSPAGANAQTYAVTFTDFLPDMTIKFTDFLPDETWRVVGQCSGAVAATSVKVTSFLPDKTIKLSRFIADRDICITNPERLPPEFREQLSRY